MLGVTLAVTVFTKVKQFGKSSLDIMKLSLVRQNLIKDTTEGTMRTIRDPYKVLSSLHSPHHFHRAQRYQWRRC